MKHPALATDLVPVNEFRSKMAQWLDHLEETGRPLVVTSRGRAAAVVIRPEAMDQMEEERALVQRILQGLREVAAGEGFDDDEVWAEVDRIIEQAESDHADPLDTTRQG